MASGKKRGPDYAKVIDPVKDFPKLKASDQYFIRKAQEATVFRGTIRRRDMKLYRGVGLALTGLVISIYVYTLRAMKQEKFLDFDVLPEESSSQDKK